MKHRRGKKAKRPKIRFSLGWAELILLFVFLAAGWLIWSLKSREIPSKTAKEVKPQATAAVKPVPVVPSSQVATVTQSPTVVIATQQAKASPQPLARAPIPTLNTPSVQESNKPPANAFPRPVCTVAEAQIALARLGISSGSVDGLMGPQTRMAIAAFQKLNALPETGQLDASTCQAPAADPPAFDPVHPHGGRH